jgi:hypothetical protein
MSKGHAANNPFLSAPVGRLFLSNALPMTVVLSMGGILNVVPDGGGGVGHAGRRAVGGWRELVGLSFDAAVDVVRFDSFSNLRRQVRGVIDALGNSVEKTSDGVAQLRVRRVLLDPG